MPSAPGADLSGAPAPVRHPPQVGNVLLGQPWPQPSVRVHHCHRLTSFTGVLRLAHHQRVYTGVVTRSFPDRLWLVRSLLNSLDAENGADDLADVDRFRGWLREHAALAMEQGEPATADRLVAAADTATSTDLELARRVRQELRAEAVAHHGDEARDPSALDRLSAEVPLAVRWSPGPALAPAGTGVRAVLGDVLAEILLAEADGRWVRMKICPADDCQVAYYDTSKNASRRWCSMEVCGNRAKTREYRKRHAHAE